MAQPQHVLPGFRRDPAGKHWDPKRASARFCLTKTLEDVDGAFALQSFVIFPSSFALLPFFTAEGSVCHPKDGLFGNVDNMSANAVFGFGVAFIAFAVLQVVLLQISVLHFRAIKRMHH